MDISKRLIITEPMYFTEPCTKCGYCRGQKPNRESYFALGSWFKRDSCEKGSQDTKSDGDGEDEGGIEVNSCTVGFQAENMTVETYDKLCNMGFRRSGRFIYKPDLLRSCCRLYTIRTKPDQVQLTKELKKCIKKFGKFIDGTSKRKDSKEQKPFDYTQELIDCETTSNRFYTRFEPAVYTEEKYELYSKYQELIHKDFKHTRSGFERFLCDSPFLDSIKIGTEEEWQELNKWKDETKEPIRRLGPAHECYYFDDKLIAIAVTDFLPSGLSSVYFIWDPDFSKWSLGKVSALRELTILSKIDRPYYYLGYYIEDCHRMNYKGAYGGELLDVCNGGYAKLEFLKNEGMISLGQFFVTWKGDTKEVVHELPLNDKLGKERVPSINVSDGTVNVAERLFGTDGVAYSGEKMRDTIRELRKFGVYYPKNEDIGPQPLKRKLKNCETYTEHFDEDENGYSESSPSSSSSSSEENMYTNGDGQEDNFHRIPEILPGALPLWELLEIIRSRRIDELNGELMFFDTRYLCFRPLLEFDRQPGDKKLLICNIVRLLGLELAKTVIVVV